jgi:hypothetical protein
LPVHEIKIDKSFIDDMIQQHDEVIVQSTIDLAHNLGLTVVAEACRTKETLDRLRELGCDTAQGDYLSAPLDAPSVPSLAPRAREPTGGSALIFALLSGVLLALSFPRYGHPAFAWIALVPLLVVLFERPRNWPSFQPSGRSRWG